MPPGLDQSNFCSHWALARARARGDTGSNATLPVGQDGSGNGYERVRR